jgi:hypothetical protein
MNERRISGVVLFFDHSDKKVIGEIGMNGRCGTPGEKTYGKFDIYPSARS